MKSNIQYKSRYKVQYYRDLFGGCPECGETRAPFWQGARDALHHTHMANRGVLLSVCGRQWGCGRNGCRAINNGCGVMQVFCYYCGCVARVDMNYPTTWEPMYFERTNA